MTDVQQIISDLERQRAAIERAIAALREITGSAAPTTNPPSTGAAKKPGRGISLEGKARIAEAQRQRWAAKRKTDARPASKMPGAGRKPATAKKATKKQRAAAEPAIAAKTGQA